MGISENLSILFCMFFFMENISATETCPTKTCGNSSIRFPFHLQGQQPQNCGFPGFGLTCTNQSNTALNLPNSGTFFVRNINYGMQQIQMYDPDNCLPRRILNFNLSGSPFLVPHYENFTFLNCPSDFARSRFTSIDCLSNSTITVLATTLKSLADSINTSCSYKTTLPVPVSLLVLQEDGFSSDLSQDLQLYWNTPDCEDCETQGGTCGFADSMNQVIGCFFSSDQGNLSYSDDTTLHVLRIISISVAIPIISCALAFILFICYVGRRHGGGAITRHSSSPNAILPQPGRVATGLGQSTIESYAKLVLGESKRLPGPNGITCPICLSDYCTKETIRCIPECKHCFHAECIDEWLRNSGTCPVCRNSPASSPSTHNQHIV
ncbi:Wall-associated receptor kinase, galacturonan-binding domain [Dillenia turbinata]|uniref:Wall-associated receptor kinase, galacturonan-binding domain n=1 Tax=Dillenia turbinata TaxID=194707 RepID=A0AAN8UZD2_9MAGN